MFVKLMILGGICHLNKFAYNDRGYGYLAVFRNAQKASAKLLAVSYGVT